MAGEFSTAGITFKWVKATSESMTSHPLSGYKEIPGIVSSPEFNPEPTTIDVTPLKETEFHRYIPALKDLGGAMGYIAFLSKEFKTAWDEMCAEDSEVWIETVIPNFDSFYYRGKPTPLGMPAFEVDAAAEVTAYITPNYTEGWGAASST